MLVTAAVFQLPIGWLNALANSNMAFTSFTLAVFQLPIGGLHVVWSLNRPAMVVTLDTSQSWILPYAFSAFVCGSPPVHQFWTAAPIVPPLSPGKVGAVVGVLLGVLVGVSVGLELGLELGVLVVGEALGVLVGVLIVLFQLR